MASNALQMVMERNEFYRTNYRWVIGGLFLAVVMILALLGVIFYQVTHPPTPQYFATTDDGKILPILPLNMPNMSDEDILLWGNNAAIAAYTYNYVNYRRELQAAAEFFTPDGWRKFVRALQDSNNLDAVRIKRLIVTAQPTGAPVLVAKGVDNGKFTWRVQVPLLVTYINPPQFAQQSIKVIITITRIPNLNSGLGIGISQFVAS
jgi:intracellular multiplication protein IcmL